MPVSLVRRVAVVFLLVSIPTLTVPAQTKRNPEEQPRKVKRELKKAYVEWINDVDLGDYVLLKDGRELSKEVENWSRINDAGQRLTLNRLIDSRRLAPGVYQMQVRIHDQVSGQTISPTATFTIEP